jgi:hypothetical protein
MSFPWWESPVPGEYRATFPAKFQAMLLDETRRRAEILCSLGFAPADVRLRVRAHLAWDYELHPLPKSAARVDEVIAAVCARLGPRPAKTAAPAPKSKAKR